MGVFILLFLTYFAFITWQIKTGRLLKWDGKWYTQQQLKEKFGPQVYEVESKNTPEEVYTKFREALLKNDIEAALMEIREEKRARYIKDFQNRSILEKYKAIPEVGKIKKAENDSIGNFSHYYYFDNDENGKEITYSIEFEKNREGYWQIDGI